jgi:hypothetical protein
MTSPGDHDADESLTDALARVGIVVTEEGKARARARLAAADAEWPPERRAAFQRHLKRPTRAA